jgi:hypothetical protein
VEKVNAGVNLDAGDDGVQEGWILTDERTSSPYDCTDLMPGTETVFINAAWMTTEKGKVEKRNKPVDIDLMHTEM